MRPSVIYRALNNKLPVGVAIEEKGRGPMVTVVKFSGFGLIDDGQGGTLSISGVTRIRAQRDPGLR